MQNQPPKRPVGRPKGSFKIKLEGLTFEESIRKSFLEGQTLQINSSYRSSRSPEPKMKLNKKRNLKRADKVKTSSTERRKRLLADFTCKEKELRLIYRRTHSISGRCEIRGCLNSSDYRTTDSKPVKRYCRMHALEIRYETLDLHDCLGAPLNDTLGIEKKDRVLLFGSRSWCCIPKDKLPEDIDSSYIPASMKRSSVYFHVDLLDRAFEQVRSGQPTNRIWKEVIRGYPSPLSTELNGYSQFLTVLQLFSCWKVKEQEFDHDDLKLVKKLSWGFKCPCCFGDPNTKKNIILILDGCFTAKRLSSSGSSASKPMLDQLYYLESPTNIRRDDIPVEACDNFRAGHLLTKALKGVDVNGIFAAVCVHGFIYRLIDVAKGESLVYAAEIAKTFNLEFPKAKLTISYDIGCKLRNIFATADVKYHKLFLPAMHSYCHVRACRAQFSPRSVLGIGIEDGENAERFWSRLPYAAHTRMMRPEIRRDFISLHANLICQASFSNLSNTLRRKISRVKSNLGSFDKELFRVASYSTVKEAIEISKREVINYSTQSLDSKSKLLKEINSIARGLIRLEHRSKTAQGTKKSALSFRAIKSTKACLIEMIESFNTTFPSNTIDYKAVVEDCKRNLHDDPTENALLFWKSLEQLVMTHRDIIDAIANLIGVQKEMDKLKNTNALDICIIEAIGVRSSLISNIISNLKVVVKIDRELYDKYKEQIKQLDKVFE